jgi:ubiquitin thioesterase protein OTUB1
LAILNPIIATESFLSATTKYGYDKFALEMFQEEFVSLLSTLSNYKTLPQSDLHKRLNEEGGTSEYCTWYMRVLAACKLKSDPERFAAFLCFEDGASAGEYVHNPHLTSNDNITDFCLKEVEPMDRECGMVQVLALAEMMNVTVAIEYLDGRPFKEEEGLTVHEFAGEDSDGGTRRSKVTLLYRPGHYDILYI